MLLLWLVQILSVKKRWLAMRNGNLQDCIYISISAPLRFGHISNWETREYGVEIAAIFIFHGPEKVNITKYNSLNITR